MDDPLKTDLRVVFQNGADADLAPEGGDLTLVSGRDNLAQALRLRLLTMRGDLAVLGHARYGSRLHELVGKPMDSANLQLLRRFVKQALLQDPRVEKVTSLSVAQHASLPGVVEVHARVLPDVEIEVALDVG